VGRDRERWRGTGCVLGKKGAVGLNKTIIRSVAVGRNRAVE